MSRYFDISFFHPITWQRALNQLRCTFNYALSFFGIVRFSHYPTFLSVEPANYCMLHCPECPVGSGYAENSLSKLEGVGERVSKSAAKKQLLQPENLQTILSQTARYAHTIQFYFQGEPLLNRQLPKLIRLAKQHRLYTIVSTNALLLNEQFAADLISSGIDKIIVSIDGITQQSYEQYRVGGSLQKALDGLRLLQQAKQRQHAHTLIVWQCLRLKTNENEWQRIEEQYRTLGADRLEWKTAQLYDYADGNPFMPTDTRYARYKQGKDGKYHLKQPLHNRCYRLWSGCVITTDGEVLPCCFDKQHTHSFGNIRQTSFPQIWHSQRATAYRKHILKARATINICQNCTP